MAIELEKEHGCPEHGFQDMLATRSFMGWDSYRFKFDKSEDENSELPSMFMVGEPVDVAYVQCDWDAMVCQICGKQVELPWSEVEEVGFEPEEMTA